MSKPLSVRFFVPAQQIVVLSVLRIITDLPLLTSIEPVSHVGAFAYTTLIWYDKQDFTHFRILSLWREDYVKTVLSFTLCVVVKIILSLQCLYITHDLPQSTNKDKLVFMLSLLCKDLCVFIVALRGKSETVFTSSLCCKFLWHCHFMVGGLFSGSLSVPFLSIYFLVHFGYSGVTLCEPVL